MGGDLVLKNSAGGETFKIDGETGFNPRLSCTNVTGSTSISCPEGKILVGASCNSYYGGRYCSLSSSSSSASCSGSSCSFPRMSGSCCSILF